MAAPSPLHPRDGRRNSDALPAEVARRAANIRRFAILQAKGKGQAYAGQGLQAADLFAALFFSEMNWSAARLADPARDRFILSTGHYAIALYATFAEAGLLTEAELSRYGDDGSPLTMGAEPGHVQGVEFAGGSLGQGLGVSAGLALGLARRGSAARVITYMSDGELQEGSVWEAAMFAAHHALSNMLTIVDVNRVQADGDLVLEIEPVTDKFRAFGWWATALNGNDAGEILDALSAARDVTDKPRALICNTRIGFGSPTIMARPFAHFVRIADDEWEKVLAEVEAAR